MAIRRAVLLLLCLALPLVAFAQTGLSGAGASFPEPMYSKWFSEYHKLHSDIITKYSNIQINRKMSGDVFKLKTTGHTKVVRPNG